MAELNPNQKKVLAVMVSPQASSIEAIARAAGVVPKTVYNYLAVPEFKQALNDLLDGALTRASARLTALADQAVEVLQDILTSKDASDTNKRLAAVSVLDSMVKLLEIKTVSDRIAKLELEIENIKRGRE